ncbi:MAG: hypothetical protein KBF83_16165 [Pyrinomonadaceae bacterium]|nr:hypothetical protein [Pyrinomonadaceae bacterium]MBP9111091.1 hypothetical protein [Pyrinomonadaceae bacterium]
MKTLLIAVLSLLLCGASAIGQEKPLSQAEYVKMLYELPKNPGIKSEIIEALRRRGIEFVLNDGVRSVTRSKSANDDELKRALEEADRRRQNPVGTQLPSAAEITTLVEKTTKNTLDQVGDMPDFVVKQQIQRSDAFAGTGNFRNRDKLIVAVSYRSSGEESYRLLSINGVLLNSTDARGSYEQAGGTSSTGEFVTMLATIFKPENKAFFEAIDTDMILGRRTVVFNFSVEKDRAKQVISAVGVTSSSTITGMRGRIWIDRSDARVLRIESEATEIPANFPILSARRSIEYDWVKIEDERYLLPSLSDVRLVAVGKPRDYETRNVIRFRNYQKFGSEVRVLDDDIKPDPEPTPIKP